MAITRLSVRLDKKTHQRLLKETRVTGKSQSELVREALADCFEACDQKESCLDLARGHGLVGRAKRLPDDLSTDPTAFEGFGR